MNVIASTAGNSSAIAVRDVNYCWKEGQPAALTVDCLEIERGQHWFVEGPSGSGKSTLLGLLSGVLDSQGGQVSILGQAMDQMTGAERDRFRADHIGYIFQMFNLIPYLTVIENITLPLQFSKQRRSRVSEPDAEAGRLLGHLGMEAFAERPVTELSVGQQQRVAAARALIGSPEIILADEPTSSLDEGHGGRFIQLLFDECARTGSTLVFVSHDARLSGHFDHRLKLEGASQ